MEKTWWYNITVMFKINPTKKYKSRHFCEVVQNCNFKNVSNKYQPALLDSTNIGIEKSRETGLFSSRFNNNIN